MALPSGLANLAGRVVSNSETGQPSLAAAAAPKKVALSSLLGEIKAGQTKLPYLPVGEFRVEVQRVVRPERAALLIFEVKVLDGEKAGRQYKIPFAFGGSTPEQISARTGDFARFAAALCGFSSTAEMFTSVSLEDVLAVCENPVVDENGKLPFAGTVLDVTATDTGAKTREKSKGGRVVQRGGETIAKYTAYPVAQ